MSNALDSLPDDVVGLKALVIEQARQLDEAATRHRELSAENTRYQTRIFTLTEQLHLALARRYAASSEKLSADQVKAVSEYVKTLAPSK